MVEVEQRRYADYITLQELESLRAENTELNLRIERLREALQKINDINADQVEPFNYEIDAIVEAAL